MIKSLYNYLFRKKKSKHQHNMLVSSEIGYWFVSEYANNREFRRTLKSKFPSFVKGADLIISKIKIDGEKSE